jgi:hypothetical protein
MLERATKQFRLQPISLAADKSYGTGEFLSWLWKRHILPYIPVLDRKHQTKGFYTQDAFTPVPEENAYRRPAGQLLRFVHSNPKAQVNTYCANASQCRNCSHKAACTPGKRRQILVSWYELERESTVSFGIPLTLP